jgi:hypothetical protein
VKETPYFKQVELMLKTIPHVTAETCFALKGGTAINLFVRDMPRLSVDIDLAYLPVEEPRETALRKENRPKLEPRILLEGLPAPKLWQAGPEKSYHMSYRVTGRDVFDARLIFWENESSFVVQTTSTRLPWSELRTEWRKRQ